MCSGRPRSEPLYRRVIIELSGEMFKGEEPPIDLGFLERVADVLIEIRQMGVQLGVVVGGGNIWRGSQRVEIDRAVSDQIGMLATLVNGAALAQLLRQKGVEVTLYNPIEIPRIAVNLPPSELRGRMERGEIIVFSGGTGNPFFTTDTGAVLRALEVGAEAVLKGTKVDGLYSDDPFSNPHAEKIDELSCYEALKLRPGVMDLTAFALAAGSWLDIIIFRLLPLENMIKAVTGEPIGTKVRGR
ncbi:UMP kinase [Candidatus Poribacteria bacterium]|nr:MAG: UMP kinase [Candidatus Poribacteria bacterium]